MPPFDRHQVKRTARQTLLNAGSGHKKLVLIHTGALLLLSLIMTALDYLLSQKINTSGGLGGIGMRSSLTTLQTALQVLQLIAIPLWQAGYVYMTLQLSQEKPVDYKTLLGGFVRFGPVLRLLLLQFALYTIAGFACMTISYTLVFSSPLVEPLLEMYEALEPGAEVTVDMLLGYGGNAFLAIILLFCALYFVVCALLYYRYRLAMYSLMDDELTGAFAAMRNSRILTKGNRMQLFKLDLSFWWFYALDALLATIYEVVVFMPLFGITLPIPDAAAAFIAFGFYGLGELALCYWRKNEMNVTYAQAYNTLMEEE